MADELPSIDSDYTKKAFPTLYRKGLLLSGSAITSF